MNAIAWPIFMVWLAFAAGDDADGMLKPPPSETRYQQFVKECNEGIHVGCIRQGSGWLTHHKLPMRQRRAILARVGNAQIALGRFQAARASLLKAIRLSPCSPLPAKIPSRAAIMFKKLQLSLFKQDKAPPILSHTPPTTEQFRKDGKIRAKATDDLHIKDVVLYYRLTPKGSYQSQPFVSMGGSRYEAKVSTKLLSSLKEFSYYIEATDCAGRRGTNESDASSPTKLVFEGKGSSGRAIGGGLLIAVGAGLLVGSSLALVNASTEGERLDKIKDPDEKARLQERVGLFQGLGWIGIALGAASIGVGIYLLFAPKKKPVAANSTTNDASTRVPVHPRDTGKIRLLSAGMP